MRRALKPYAVRARVAGCGRRIASQVEIMKHAASGSASYRGLLMCGSVWTCPVCAARICAKRARQITDVVRHYRAKEPEGAVYLLTLTVRHGLGDELRAVFEGVAKAWQKTCAGAPWLRWRVKCSVDGYIRAAEVTHGFENGWHPHLHILVFTRDPLAFEEELGWLAERWQKCVRRSLGERHVPELFLGCDAREARDGNYIAKLGLELGSGDGKAAKNGNRSPWQIAHDVATQGESRDVAVWSAYQRATKGRKQLTWSKDARQMARLAGAVDADRTDEELLDEPDEDADRVLYTLTPAEWRIVQAEPGLPCRLLEAAERRGPGGVEQELRAAVLRAARRWVHPP